MAPGAHTSATGQALSADHPARAPEHYAGEGSLLESPIGLPRRGLPVSPGRTTTLQAIRGAGRSVVRGEVTLPAMVLHERALANNIEVMASYAREHGYHLAPHGKTTMSPELFRRQLEAGAWGITVANVAQAGVALDAGASRVLIANEVVGRAETAWLAAQLATSGADLYCLVDSVEGVALLDERLAEVAGSGRSRRLEVLVELGIAGGRAGTRGIDDALLVADAVANTRRLRLAGVEGYEGSVATDRSPDAIRRVDAYLADIRRLVNGLGERGALAGSEPVIVSAGGSKYFDRVADVLGNSEPYPGLEVELVVRSGCYLTHDHGIYAVTSPLASTGDAGRHLVGALEVWAEVQSAPEHGLVIVGIGKRDVPYDLGLPIPLHAVRRGGPVVPFTDARLSSLDDQHGYLRLDDGATLAVGDLVGFGLSHPCTAFDKWAIVPVVDDDYVVVDLVRTCFH